MRGLIFFFLSHSKRNKCIHFSKEYGELSDLKKDEPPCESCIYYVPDTYYPGLGKCRLFREYANVCRIRKSYCGKNGTHWKSKNDFRYDEYDNDNTYM